MALAPASSHGGSSSPVIAAVKLSAQISNWDGNPIPFDLTLLDADSLWDSVNHQFVPKAAGWYRVATFGTGSTNAQVFAAATATTGPLSLDAVVNGAGDNLHSNADEHAAITSGSWHFPQIVGMTHLDIGDGIDIESPNAVVGLTVPAGFCFSIERVVAT